MISKPTAFNHSLLNGNSDNLNDLQEIWLLHGYASNESDLYALESYFGKKYLIRSLRAPFQIPTGGFAWYGLDFDTGGLKESNLKQAQESAIRIKDALDWHKESHPSSPRPILLGFSQGGIMANALGYSLFDELSAVVSIASYFPLEWDFLKQSSNKVKYFAAVGTDDIVVPAEKSLPSYTKAQNYHGIDLQLKTYSMPHTISQACISDVLRFISERNKIS
tara:strand:+ start:487 stop:1149 length:663 start_codon:yes stop_codon:yes gene_type:complete